jgi:uncharacterized protein
MSIPYLILLTTLGFGGACVAGLLGVGGAILMIPLLLYVPPWLGFPPLSVQTVAAISMVQVLSASLSGAIAHGRRGGVHRALAVSAGALSALGAFGGGIASRWMPAWGLLAVFAGMATAGAALLCAAPREVEPAGDAEPPFVLRRARAALVGLGVGSAAGLVGAGGAFLLLPLLITVVGVPTRVTIGSSLAITLWTALAGVAGKLVTGQIPLLPAAALVVGAVPGAQWGAWLSRRARLSTLRGLLIGITALVAIRAWIDVYLAWR